MNEDYLFLLLYVIFVCVFFLSIILLNSFAIKEEKINVVAECMSEFKKLEKDFLETCVKSDANICIAYKLAFRNPNKKVISDKYYYAIIDKTDLVLVETETQWKFKPIIYDKNFFTDILEIS